MYYVKAEKEKGSLESIRMNGFKHLDSAIAVAKRYTNAMVQQYTGSGLKAVFIKTAKVEIVL